MKKYFDIAIRPISESLDKTMGVKHVPVAYLPTEREVTVMVKYYFDINNSKVLRNGYIKDLKAMGLI